MAQAATSPTIPALEWAAEAHERLAAEGHRAGGARSAVIDLLAREGGCLEAEQVADLLGAEGRRVGTASVYRALALLGELGLLQRVNVADGPARYELVLPSGEHHHHIVCDRCGRTTAFSDRKLERAIEAIGEDTSFTIEAHEVTLHGICSACNPD